MSESPSGVRLRANTRCAFQSCRLRRRATRVTPAPTGAVSYAGLRRVKLLSLLHGFQDRAGQLPGPVDRQLHRRPPTEAIGAADEVDVDGVVERGMEGMVI